MSGLFQGIHPLSQALGYHMDRHNVLATNVAHVETPGFKPKEVERAESQDFGLLMSKTLTRTNAAHLSAGGTTGVTRGQVIDSPDAETGLDGNGVSLDVEATKIAENRLRYEVISALTAAEFRQLSYAVNDGR
jgi:flagellar basal-body rod protein FlgB